MVQANKELPAKWQRYFIRDYIADGDTMDCMVIEISADEYAQWDKERSAVRRNREAEKGFRMISLDAPVVSTDGSVGRWEQISGETQLESMVCNFILIDELKEALAAWKLWAVDLLELCLCGQRRACTEKAAQKRAKRVPSIQKRP